MQKRTKATVNNKLPEQLQKTPVESRSQSTYSSHIRLFIQIEKVQALRSSVLSSQLVLLKKKGKYHHFSREKSVAGWFDPKEASEASHTPPTLGWYSILSPRHLGNFQQMVLPISQNDDDLDLF